MPKGQWKLTLADVAVGTLSSWINILAGYPLDFIKTRMQIYSDKYNNAWQYFKHIIKHEGFLTLYRVLGISSPILGSIFTGSIFFSSYELAKRNFHQFNQQQGKKPQIYLPLWQVFLSGSFAGMMTDTLNIPIEFAKIQIQQRDYSKKSKVLGPIGIIREVIKKKGLRYIYKYQSSFYNEYRGTSIQLFRNFVGVGAFFSSHDTCMRLFTPPGKSRLDVPQVGIMCAGASAGFAFWTIAYPIDLIKTQIQGDDIYNPKHKTVMGYINEVYQKGGLRRFYKGYRVSVLRSMYTNFVQLFVYENLHKIVYKAIQPEN